MSPEKMESTLFKKIKECEDRMLQQIEDECAADDAMEALLAEAILFWSGDPRRHGYFRSGTLQIICSSTYPLYRSKFESSQWEPLFQIRSVEAAQHTQSHRH